MMEKNVQVILCTLSEPPVHSSVYSHGVKTEPENHVLCVRVEVCSRVQIRVTTTTAMTWNFTAATGSFRLQVPPDPLFPL